MSLCVIHWNNKELDVKDWSTNKDGYLVRRAEIKWDGESTTTLLIRLIRWLVEIPEYNNYGWSKNRIESIRLDGNLEFGGGDRSITVFATCETRPCWTQEFSV